MTLVKILVLQKSSLFTQISADSAEHKVMQLLWLYTKEIYTTISNSISLTRKITMMDYTISHQSWHLWTKPLMVIIACCSPTSLLECSQHYDINKYWLKVGQWDYHSNVWECTVILTRPMWQWGSIPNINNLFDVMQVITGALQMFHLMLREICLV